MAYPFPFWVRLLGDIYTIEFCANLCISLYRDILDIARCYEACIRARGNLPGKDRVRVVGNNVIRVYIEQDIYPYDLSIQRRANRAPISYLSQTSIQDTVSASLQDTVSASLTTPISDIIGGVDTTQYLISNAVRRMMDEYIGILYSESVRTAINAVRDTTEDIDIHDIIDTRYVINRRVDGIDEGIRIYDEAYYRPPGFGVYPVRVVVLEYIDPLLDESSEYISETGGGYMFRFSRYVKHYDTVIARAIPLTPVDVTDGIEAVDYIRALFYLISDTIASNVSPIFISASYVTSNPLIQGYFISSAKSYILSVYYEEPGYLTYQSYIGDPGVRYISASYVISNQLIQESYIGDPGVRYISHIYPIANSVIISSVVASNISSVLRVTRYNIPPGVIMQNIVASNIYSNILSASYRIG